MDLVEHGQRSNYRIILMGDFNVNPEKYMSHYNRSGKFHWKYQIIHDLMNHNMVDTVDLHQDIDDTTPHNTYFPTQPNHNPSRLDLIYVSRDLVVDVLHSNNYQGDMISSDHHAVFASFNTNTIFERQSLAQLKQHKIRRCIFSHDIGKFIIVKICAVQRIPFLRRSANLPARSTEKNYKNLCRTASV
jgi:hypothetical protein